MATHLIQTTDDAPSAFLLRCLEGVRTRQIRRIKDCMLLGWRINPLKHDVKIDPIAGRVYVRFTTEMMFDEGECFSQGET